MEESDREELQRASDLLVEEGYEKAHAILERRVASGCVEALALLGMTYQLGLGVEPDGVKAEAMLLKAAENGSGIAAHNLGTLYISGAPGLQPKPELSKRYYRMARDLGQQLAPDSFYE